MNKKLLGIGIFVSVFVFAIVGIHSKILAAPSPTANINFVLTTPIEDGIINHLTGGGSDEDVNVDVANGTTSVVITATKLASQTVTLSADHGETEGGARDDSRNIVVTGTDTNPIYTINTVTPGDNVSVGGGNKTFTFSVTETSRGAITYTVNVQVAQPPLSTDSTLRELSISNGTLSPKFSSSSNSYTARVSNHTESITVTPTANEGHATITVKGENVDSGEESDSIHLDTGANVITVEVTAEDSSTNSYEITVTREKPSSKVIGSYTSSYKPGILLTPISTSITTTTPIVLSTPETSSTNSLIQKIIKDLKFGMISNDIKVLQLFLISQNKGPASLALKNHGATNTFGKLTKASLLEWQKANGLATDGIFGPKTRELIKSLSL